VVAVHVGTPPTRARTCPFVPAVVVAILPVPLPIKTVLAVKPVAHPVPPLDIGNIPVTSLARSIKDVDITPAVAFKNPESEPTVSEPKTALVDDAYVAVMFVVDAFVTVNSVEASLNVNPELPPESKAGIPLVELQNGIYVEVSCEDVAREDEPPEPEASLPSHNAAEPVKAIQVA